MLEAAGGVEVVGTAGDGPSALSAIESHQPDLVFLDIGLPGFDGMEVAERAPADPAVIFVTAHADFALEAFEAEAVDYLLKPVDPNRLVRAIERARERVNTGDLSRALRRIAENAPSAPSPRRITARRGASLLYFDPLEITCFVARDKYTGFVHGGEKHLAEESLHNLSERLGPHGFLRVHRSILVRLDAVRALTTEGGVTTAELIDGQSVPVSRRRAGALREALEAL